MATFEKGGIHLKAESRQPVGHDRVIQLLEASQRGLEMNLKVQEVAALTGLSISTLAMYRYKGGGPKFFRIPGSRSIRYHLSDVMDYMSSTTDIKTSGTDRFCWKQVFS